MPSFQDDHKGLKRLLLQKTMASPQRETWRPFVGKTNVGAERDNGGKLLLWFRTKCSFRRN